MRNKITDLNDHLFAQLERLSDEDLQGENLDKEISRSKAMTQIASNIIESSRVTVEAMKIMRDSGADITKIGKDVLFHSVEGRQLGD